MQSLTGMLHKNNQKARWARNSAESQWFVAEGKNGYMQWHTTEYDGPKWAGVNGRSENDTRTKPLVWAASSTLLVEKC